MISGIHHVGVIVNDVEIALNFYRDVLGGKVIFQELAGPDYLEKGTGIKDAHAKMVVMKVGSATLELIEYTNPRTKAEGLRPCDAGTFHLSFEVDDINKTMEQLQEKGVKFSSEPNISGGEFEGWVWVYFKDPDGHQLELVENRELKHPL
jgi:catechol 2,3-dioxygenase-like lactoylglutathione lyase family enzyme